jgi:hypothetical protein
LPKNGRNSPNAISNPSYASRFREIIDCEIEINPGKNFPTIEPSACTP